MSLYEAVNDKLTVVLDIGVAYTKFGFTGEFAPRCIIKSEVRCKQTNQIKRIWDYSNDKDELFDLLVEFIHEIYFKYAHITPKERSIVIVESLLCPTVFRETLAKVIFNYYEMSIMCLLPSHLVSLASLPIGTALVVDVGYKEAVAIPICHGLPLIEAWQALPIGSQAVQNNLKVLLAKDNTGVDKLSESDLENIKVRCCFVTTQLRAEQLHLAKPDITWSPDVRYPIDGDRIVTVSGKTREKAFEVLYEEDNDHLCLSTMILDAIFKTNMDLRNSLAENILLIGGGAMAQGFKARLRDELMKQLKSKRYKNLHVKQFAFHTAPAKENYTAWLGGSLYGATDLLNMKSMTKEMYLKDNRLPDWTHINSKDA